MGLASTIPERRCDARLLPGRQQQCDKKGAFTVLKEA